MTGGLSRAEEITLTAVIDNALAATLCRTIIGGGVEGDTAALEQEAVQAVRQWLIGKAESLTAADGWNHAATITAERTHLDAST